MYDTVPKGHISLVCLEIADGARQCSWSRKRAQALRQTMALPKESTTAPPPGQSSSKLREQPLGKQAGFDGRMETAALYVNRLTSVHPMRQVEFGLCDVVS